MSLVDKAMGRLVKDFESMKEVAKNPAEGQPARRSKGASASIGSKAKAKVVKGQKKGVTLQYSVRKEKEDPTKLPVLGWG